MDIEEIIIKRKIEREKGSKYFINDKEVRARDVQTFFADFIYWRSLSINNKSGKNWDDCYRKTHGKKIGFRRSCRNFRIHIRRHEAETRLNAAENNLKRADELKKTTGETT